MDHNLENKKDYFLPIHGKESIISESYKKKFIIPLETPKKWWQFWKENKSPDQIIIEALEQYKEEIKIN